MPFALEVFAVHRLDIDVDGKRVVPVGSARAGDLPKAVRERLEAYAQNLHARDEATDANAVAAWFAPRVAGPVGELLLCGAGEFDERTRAAMEWLRGLTPGSSRSAGVVLFLRGAIRGEGALAVVKLAPGDVEHTRFDRSAREPARAIAVETIADVLPPPGELRKAALLPSPGDGDLRIIDVQFRGDAAGYWLSFLGAAARPPLKQTAKAAGNVAIDVLEQDLGLAGGRATVLEGMPRGAATSISVRDFFDELSDRSGVSRDEVWSRATARDEGLASPNLVVSGASDTARRLIVDLGEGVRLAGPAHRLDPRLEVARDDEGWYVKVRPEDPARRPNPRFG